MLGFLFLPSCSSSFPLNSENLEKDPQMLRKGRMERRLPGPVPWRKPRDVPGTQWVWEGDTIQNAGAAGSGGRVHQKAGLKTRWSQRHQEGWVWSETGGKAETQSPCPTWAQHLPRARGPLQNRSAAAKPTRKASGIQPLDEHPAQNHGGVAGCEKLAACLPDPSGRKNTSRREGNSKARIN